MRSHDVLIVGSGLAGLRAAIELVGELDVGILTKVYPSRSHSGAAQGGVAAALGNVDPEDSIETHLYDTVKGSDFLADQDSAEILCSDAPEAIYEMEKFGCPFSRTEEKKIAQRAFGGHTYKRSCYSADRTGHALLHTLFEQSYKHKGNMSVYSEYYMLDLVMQDGATVGLTAMDIRTGKIELFQGKSILFATGGYGRAFQITSNAFANTGDGIMAAYRAGLPLMDMEFVQFHPTGLYKHGILLSEAARGEGGYLLNGKMERFMSRYAPSKMELGPRDIVSRSEQTEINEGRGAGPNKDYILLDLRHLGKEKIMERLPQVYQLAKDFIGVDAITDPVPIQPTAHYSMGGIPSDNFCRVLADEKGKIVKGFYAAGECACVSVHGANRLGTNSLLDALVFGRRAGKQILKDATNNKNSFSSLDESAILKGAQSKIAQLYESDAKESINEIRNELKDTMTLEVGVYRTASKMEIAKSKIAKLRERFKNIRVDDKKPTFNTNLQEALELSNMLEYSQIIVEGGLAREESRGAHARDDFPTRDDEKWLAHTLAFKESDDGIKLKYKDVRITKYQPEERKY
ncbi:MAG: succinate dehydrogenase flavoprotein subunit [Nitrospinota bacterium]